MKASFTYALARSVLAAVMMCSTVLAGPGGSTEEDQQEIINVHELEGTSGCIRGFNWTKDGDDFYMEPVPPRSSNIYDVPFTLPTREEMETYVGKVRQSMDEYQIDLQDGCLYPNPLELGVTTFIPRPGNLRINNPYGGVHLHNVRITGDLIIDAKSLRRDGYIYSYTFVMLFPCQKLPGISITAGSGGNWSGAREDFVARSRNFHPYNNHTLIQGRSN